MGMTVHRQGSTAVDLSDLKDGQVAVIVEHGEYAGRVVQRHKESLVSLGRPSVDGWTSYFRKLGNLRGTLLTNGTLLRIDE